MNLGVRNLLAAAGDATIEDIATQLGFDRTYCGRVLASKRPASLAFRQRALDRYGIALGDWDQEVPDSDQLEQPPNPSSSSLG